VQSDVLEGAKIGPCWSLALALCIIPNGGRNPATWLSNLTCLFFCGPGTREDEECDGYSKKCHGTEGE
jgi:hypothetical protein